MSTATHVPEGFKLPSVLKLDYATIAIPDDLTSIDSLKELSTVIAETNHLLSLLSDEDKRNPTYEDDAGWSLRLITKLLLSMQHSTTSCVNQVVSLMLSSTIVVKMSVRLALTNW